MRSPTARLVGMTKSRGFTLLEILVAMTIMTMLTVSGIVLFSDLSRHLAWKKLTAAFEQNFWRAQSMSLTQTGDQPPQSHYLYFESGQESSTPFVLEHLELAKSSFPAALISFDSPFAAISFHGLPTPWSQTKPFPTAPACELNCSLILTYSRPGSEEKKAITIDSEKHLEFSF